MDLKGNFFATSCLLSGSGDGGASVSSLPTPSVPFSGATNPFGIAQSIGTPLTAGTYLQFGYYVQIADGAGNFNLIVSSIMANSNAGQLWVYPCLASPTQGPTPSPTASPTTPTFAPSRPTFTPTPAPTAPSPNPTPRPTLILDPAARMSKYSSNGFLVGEKHKDKHCSGIIIGSPSRLSLDTCYLENGFEGTFYYKWGVKVGPLPPTTNRTHTHTNTRAQRAMGQKHLAISKLMLVYADSACTVLQSSRVVAHFFDGCDVKANVRYSFTV